MCYNNTASKFYTGVMVTMTSVGLPATAVKSFILQVLGVIAVKGFYSSLTVEQKEVRTFGSDQFFRLSLMVVSKAGAYPRRAPFSSFLGPYYQHFSFFVTFECAN